MNSQVCRLLRSNTVYHTFQMGSTARHWRTFIHWASFHKLSWKNSYNRKIWQTCRRQAIIWFNAGILLIRTLGTNFSEILSKIHTFPFKKIHLKASSGKWRPFCLGLNVFNGPLCTTASIPSHFSLILHNCRSQVWITLNLQFPFSHRMFTAVIVPLHKLFIVYTLGEHANTR